MMSLTIQYTIHSSAQHFNHCKPLLRSQWYNHKCFLSFKFKNFSFLTYLAYNKDDEYHQDSSCHFAIWFSNPERRSTRSHYSFQPPEQKYIGSADQKERHEESYGQLGICPHSTMIQSLHIYINIYIDMHIYVHIHKLVLLVNNIFFCRKHT